MDDNMIPLDFPPLGKRVDFDEVMVSLTGLSQQHMAGGDREVAARAGAAVETLMNGERFRFSPTDNVSSDRFALIALNMLRQGVRLRLPHQNCVFSWRLHTVPIEGKVWFDEELLLFAYRVPPQGVPFDCEWTNIAVGRVREDGAILLMPWCVIALTFLPTPDATDGKGGTIILPNEAWMAMEEEGRVTELNRHSTFLLASLGLLMTKGIERSVEEPSDRLIRARAKAGKPPPHRLTTIITPGMSHGPHRQGEGQGGHHGSPMPHTRRGHLRMLPGNRPTWVRNTVVNADANITRRNEYRVKGPPS